MKITWLGQAGLLFESNGIKLIADPYLSDSVEKINPQNFRRVPVKEELFGEDIDIIVITHNHLDHLDPKTLERFLNIMRGRKYENSAEIITMLCSTAVRSGHRTV